MTDAPPLAALVLAAGAGTRMHSERPKALHLLAGKAMLLYVLDSLAGCTIDRAVVVVGVGAEKVTKKLQEQGPGLLLEFVEQHEQRGTGDAVSVGLTGFAADDLDEGDVLVLPGDTPLLRRETISALVERHRSTEAACTLLTAELDDPFGYGRIVRGKDERVRMIVEEADATDDERGIREINTSIYCFRRSVLAPALRRLSPENAQGEYYLTDVVEVLYEAGYPVVSLVADDPMEITGVNDRIQLAGAEAELRRRTNLAWMRQGVTMLDPVRTYIDSTVTLAADVTLFPGTMLQGSTVVGSRSEIGPDTRLVDTAVGADCRVEKTMARRADIADDSRVGPFAVLGSGAEIVAGTVTGPFYTADIAETSGVAEHED